MQLPLLLTTSLLLALASPAPLPSSVSTSSSPALPHPLNARAPVPTARVQLNFAGEGAIQVEVPLDNSIFTKFFGSDRFSTASINSGPKGVPLSKISCQAYTDKKATKKLGKPFTGVVDGVFSTNGKDVVVGALRCKRI